MAMEEVGLLGSLLAGIASFVSPCVLPLVPAYLSMVTGLTAEELREKGGQGKTLLKCGLFVLGFSVIFVLMGATASTLGQSLVQHRRLLNIILGIVVVLMGLFMAGLIRIPSLDRVRRIAIPVESLSPLGPLAAMATGAAFALGWTPCVGPVLSSILAYAAASGSLGKGVLLLSTYSLGLGIPFLLTGLLYSRALGALDWFRRNQKWANTAAGALLAVMGILLVFDAMGP